MIAFVSIGGTDFQSADLTDADFMRANLKCVNFRDTILTRVNWHQVKKLYQIRTNSISLLDSEIRSLVVSHKGAGISLVGRSLRGINLAGADLSNADLSETDVSEATFENGWLEGANLSRVKALGTNFKGTRLTGACLENWKIDKTTSLDHVICDYVYLQANLQERRPASSNFAQGDFTTLFEKVLETIDLVFQEGIDWKAFLSTFQELQVQYGEQNLSIQSIEQKKYGAFIIRVNIPINLDKARIEHEIKELYRQKLQVLEAKYREKLRAKKKEIEIHRRNSANLLEVVKLAASRPITVEAIAMVENQSNSENYNTDLRRANVGNFANKVQDNARQQANQYNTLEQKQTLNEAAIEIKKLLEQLEELYPSRTKTEQALMATKAVEEIEKNPVLKQRVIGALRAGGVEALKELVDHPAVGIVLAAVEGWQNPE